MAATIDRLQRVRAELAVILHHETSADLPLDLAATISPADLTPQDRALTIVMAQVLSPEVLATFADVMRDYSKDPVTAEFDTLPEDADEQTRQSLAERMNALPYMRKMRAAFPDAGSMYSDAPRGKKFAFQVLRKVIVDLYNEAQMDVLIRMNT